MLHATPLMDTQPQWSQEVRLRPSPASILLFVTHEAGVRPAWVDGFVAWWALGSLEKDGATGGGEGNRSRSIAKSERQGVADGTHEEPAKDGRHQLCHARLAQSHEPSRDALADLGMQSKGLTASEDDAR